MYLFKSNKENNVINLKVRGQGIGEIGGKRGKGGNDVNVEFMYEILKIIKHFDFKNTLYFCMMYSKNIQINLKDS